MDLGLAKDIENFLAVPIFPTIPFLSLHFLVVLTYTTLS